MLSFCCAAICMLCEALLMFLALRHHDSQPLPMCYVSQFHFTQSSAHISSHVLFVYFSSFEISITAHHACFTRGKETSIVANSELESHHMNCPMPCRTSTSLLTPHGSSPQRLNSRAEGQQLKGAWPGSCCTVQMAVRIPD